MQFQPVLQAVAPVHDERRAQRRAARDKSADAGIGWFGMQAPDVTPEVKRDWRLLRLRAAFDPRHFYKVRPYNCCAVDRRCPSCSPDTRQSRCLRVLSPDNLSHQPGCNKVVILSGTLRPCKNSRAALQGFDSTRIPKHFEMGTVVAGAGEFYSGRLTRRERRQTFTEEVLADLQIQKERKRRFEAMQAERQEVARKQKKMKAHHKRSRHRPKH